MSDKAFLDTNILVYRFDRHEPAKQERARQILDTEATFSLSTQVLQELFVTLTRKLEPPLEGKLAAQVIQNLTALEVVQIDPAMIADAIDLHLAHSISFWDALIVRAAVRSGCRRLLTEDLQHGWRIEGLEVVNPFADSEG